MYLYTDIGMSFFSANDFLFNNDLSIHSGQILWAMGGTQKGYRKGYSYRCVWPAGQGGVAKVGLTMPPSNARQIVQLPYSLKLLGFA